MCRHLRISSLIRESLANDAPKHALGAPLVINAKRDALIIPEIELGKIAVKMALRTVLIDALHATFEDREIALDGVGVNFAASVFTAIVADHAMRGEAPANRLVVGSFVGHQPRFSGKVLTHQWPDGAGFEVVNDHAPHLAAIAVNQRQNLVLVSVAPALLLVLRFNGLVVADESLVSLDGSAASAERGEVATAHRFADAMAHEPSGFQGHAQGTMQLVRADALLAGANQEDRLQPDMQLDVACLEDGADLDGERLAAGIALVGAYAGAFAFQLAAAIDHAAVRANANPQLLLAMF